MCASAHTHISDLFVVSHVTSMLFSRAAPLLPTNLCGRKSSLDLNYCGFVFSYTGVRCRCEYLYASDQLSDLVYLKIVILFSALHFCALNILFIDKAVRVMR